MMMVFLFYLVEVSLCLSVFYAFYYLLLRKSRYFLCNRYYLLWSALLALVLPFIQLPMPVEEGVVREVAVTLQTFTVTPNGIAQWEASSLFNHLNSFLGWLVLVYGLGVVLFAGRLGLQLRSFYRLSKQLTKVKCNGYWLIKTEKQPTFSFFNYLFLNVADLTQAQQQQIIRHEEVHIRQKHTFDILFFELLSLVCWFNPVMYWYKQAIRDTHEYLADAAVLKQQPQHRKQYAQLMVQQVLTGHNLYLFNHFSQSQIQKRMMMMNTKIKTRFMGIRYAFILPLLAFVCVWFACNDVTATHEEPNQVAEMKQTLDESVASGKLKPEQAEDLKAKAEAKLTGDESMTEKETNKTLDVSYVSPPKVPTKSEDDPDIYTIVEDMPEFYGGNEALFKFLGEQVSYPKTAKDQGIEGTVYVHFVVDKQGVISNAEIARGVREDLNLEAIRVVRSMPNWKPGKQKGELVKVRYTLPFKFKLD